MFNPTSLVLLFISYFVIPRLTFLPQSLHTLLILFGPFLLPRAVDSINTLRATARNPRVPIRPVPPKVQRALNILFISAVCCLIATLPYFGPENVFIKTQSRLQISADVLFARLRLLRPLSSEDETLRTKFGSRMDNKLAYIAFGPDTLANCIWCSTSDSNDAMNYLLYSIPKILAPHILHLLILGLSTSSFFVGNEGARFRTHATIAGLFLAVSEIWYLASYDMNSNKRAKVLGEIDFVHWRVRIMRLLAFAAVDGLFGLFLWATSTNRWLATPPSIAERIESSTRQVEDTLNKLRALGLLKNSINRDQNLRGVVEQYWQTEAEVMAQTVQEAEVMTEINRVVSSMDLNGLEGRVGQVADGILAGLDQNAAPQPSPGG